MGRVWAIESGFYKIFFTGIKINNRPESDTIVTNRTLDIIIRNIKN